MKKKPRILLVEDDQNLGMVLVDYLVMLGYEVILREDGESGMAAYKGSGVDLCLLDIMMPKKDGFTLAEEIRKSDQVVPIIFLTANNLKEDRIKGFRLGCDDYITKPFHTEELSLRIEAVLRRCRTPLAIGANGETVIYQIGSFEFDYTNMVLIREGKVQNLTRKEADLLRLLCENQNTLVKRETALRLIWGTDDYFIGRSMDVFITKLRKYLKPDPSISIMNVHGTGFKLHTGSNDPDAG
ncbi:MAG TPA: response regulator transcription factor [Bacteroidales bacterium]|nr:response regulator transcription factor [Bacteroidales bacterium]